MDWRKSSYSGYNGDCAEVAVVWHKSSYSTSGHCAEVATVWGKSSYSESGNCAEVAQCPDGVAVRDSKDPGGPVLAFSAGQWRAFLHTIKDGVCL